MTFLQKLIWAHQKYIGACHDNPERYILAVRPELDELAKNGGWTYCTEEQPVGYPRYLIALRPEAPLDKQVMTVWNDPFNDGWHSEYPVIAWMERPEQPNLPAS